MKKVTKKIEFSSSDELEGVFIDEKTLKKKNVDVNEHEVSLSLRKAIKYKKNPFVFDDDDKLIIDLPSRIKKNYYVSMEYDDKTFYQTGELTSEEGGHYIYSKKEIDPEQFVKVYTAGISAMYDLSKSGIKALHYCTTILVPDNDVIYIYIPHMIDFCGWKSKKQAYVGLKELVKAQIIAPSFYPGKWFINPRVMFNGNRLMLIQDIRKKEVKPTKQIDV
jgi:hypothetical protein